VLEPDVDLPPREWLLTSIGRVSPPRIATWVNKALGETNSSITKLATSDLE